MHVFIDRASLMQVSTLQKLLRNERKVHEILENVHNRKDGSPIYIPNFLPPKVIDLFFFFPFSSF